MKITVTKLDEKQHMEANNEEGGTIRMDGSREIGGLEGGISPMQLLLAGIGGCSTIDIVGILEKQKQPLKNISVEVDGDRRKAGTYSEFKSIHLKFQLKGDLDPKKVERAINLSIDKYCSVSKALEKTSTITHSFTINN
ncbi:MAG: OsmC family protein [Balneolaceae bacterium]|nr:OsmC family protein [Balneolaceae bacterium]